MAVLDRRSARPASPVGRRPGARGSSDVVRLLPALLVTVVLFGGALVGAVKQSVEPPLGGAVSTWSLDSWRAMFSDPGFWDALRFSTQLALIASLASAGIALLAATWLRSRGRGLKTIFSVPVTVPHLLVAVVAVSWLAPGGIADRALGSLPIGIVHARSGLGIILVYVYKETPFLVLLLLAVMGRTLRRREEAAAVLGASPGQVLRWVVWPAVRRPLLIGTMIVAAFVFGAFEVPLLLGPNYPPTLATYAFQATQASALSGQGKAAASLLVAAGASVVIGFAIMRLARAGDD
ncbi:MAG: sugar ABC transporter permease [Actinobacteria bacterium]|nr:sugar ABC transporter permease [Actinomycetota bacterium]